MGYSYSLTCTGCNYESFVSIRGTNYYFFHEGENQDYLKSTIGRFYCRTCENFEATFMGAPRKSSELIELEKKILTLSNKLKSISSINIFQLVYIKLNILIIKYSKNKEVSKTYFKENQIFWEIAKAKPRCLKCEGFDIDIETGRFESHPEQTKTMHKCGGFLKIRRSLTTNQIKPYEVVYDINGVVLK
jgi:hypothetical protein